MPRAARLAATIDARRLRKLRRFFARVFISVLWWDVILNRPLLRALRPAPLPRWRRLAREYRALALEMGGVLIKLGQFLSVRTDILPPEVVSELTSLQDEVAPEPTAAIVAQIESDFGRPIAQIFAWFSPQPIGSASLAQAHLARLVSGEQVAVKVLRPGIDVTVETDLVAISQLVRRFKQRRQINRYADIGQMADEFISVTRNELNLPAEGRNAERVAQDFADDAQVYIPRVYWDYTTAHIITMENVGYFRIDNTAAIDAAGIPRAEVVKTLYRVYLQQFFKTSLVHADPHPGNLFVKPLPLADEVAAGVVGFQPDDPVPYGAERPFQLVLIDFGMVVTIPERLQASLREYAIGIGTRDAHMIVQSYQTGGMVPPGTDLQRLEEATEAILQNFGNTLVGLVGNVSPDKMRAFSTEYQDVVRDSPMQFQSDMLFVYRAMGMLSGIANRLDPDFDLWSVAGPLAERLLVDDLQKNWRQRLHELAITGQRLARTPAKLDQLLTQAQRGGLTVQVALSPNARKSIQRVEQSLNRLAWLVVSVGLLIAGTIWHVGGLIAAAVAPTSARDSAGLWLIGLGLVAFVVGIARKR